MPFQIIPEFLGAPGGVCFTCRAAKRTGDVVVDCDYEVESLNATVPTEIPGMQFEIASGSLQICGTCVTEMGTLLGMASADKTAKLEQMVSDLSNERDSLKKEFVEAARMVQTLFEVKE